MFSAAIAARVCVDWHRRNRVPSRAVASADPITLENLRARHGDAPHDDADRETLLWQAIDDLQEELREVLLLFYCDDLSYDAIAEWLNVSRSTVNSRLAKARDTLKRHMIRKQLEPDRGLPGRS